MRVMKDSGVYWIGSIPKNWLLLPTKRFFRTEKRIVGDSVNEYERLALTMQGVIKRSKDDSEGLQPEKFEGYQILRENELVFKLIDLENVKTSRVGLSPYTGLVSPAYIVMKNDHKDNRFFYYWFMFMYYNEVFNQLGGTGVRSALNAKDVCNLPVPSIDYEEQSRIADYLDSKCSKIDSIIEKQKQIIEKLKEYKTSLITEVVTKGLDPNVEMKDSGVEWIGKIPKRWKISKIKNVAKTSSGGTPSSGIKEYYDGNINWVCSYDLHGSVITESERKISSSGADVISGTLQSPNCVLVAMYGGAGTVGNCGLLQCYAYTNQAVCSISFEKSLIVPLFGFYVIKFLKEFWMIYAVGSRKDPNISQETVKEMYFVIPSIDEQLSIADYLDRKCFQVDTLIKKKEQIIEKLKEYKKSLIYEAVTGKREV